MSTWLNKELNCIVRKKKRTQQTYPIHVALVVLISTPTEVVGLAVKRWLLLQKHITETLQLPVSLLTSRRSLLAAVSFCFLTIDFYTKTDKTPFQEVIAKVPKIWKMDGNVEKFILSKAGLKTVWSLGHQS